MWDAAAAGWEQRDRWMRETSRAVSTWLVDALRLQPGHRVLELAAGTGDTGFLAAELILPGGRLISSDRSGPMLTAARTRAAELGLANVEFKLLDGEAIDLPLAAVDAVICRWGYMLMADPAAGLRETRRVLAPGGRLALAVWDRIEANPWARIPRDALIGHGLLAAPAADEPGPFALADPDRVGELLEEAGFTDIELDAVDLLRPDPDFATWWDGHLAMSMLARQAMAGADADVAAAVRAEVEQAVGAYAQPDGSLLVPARTLVAAAEA